MRACSWLVCVLGLFSFLGAAKVHAQTPLQRQFFQAQFYQQMAAQQRLYPVPVFPAATRLSYIQYANELNKAAPIGGFSRISAVDSARIDRLLRTTQLWQTSWYPQTVVASYAMPMNVVQLATGTTGPFPPALPPAAFVGLEVAQERTVSAIGNTAMVASSAYSPTFAAAAQSLQTLLFNGMKQAKAIARAKAVQRRVKNRDGQGEMTAALFREGPGERELELGQLWMRVDKEKARDLLLEAVNRAKDHSPVAKEAKKELKALDSL